MVLGSSTKAWSSWPSGVAVRTVTPFSERSLCHVPWGITNRSPAPKRHGLFLSFDEHGDVYLAGDYVDDLVALGVALPSGVAIERAKVDGGMAEVAAAEDLEPCDYHVLGGVGAPVGYRCQVLYGLVYVVNLYHLSVLSVVLLYPEFTGCEYYNCKCSLLQVSCNKASLTLLHPLSC